MTWQKMCSLPIKHEYRDGRSYNITVGRYLCSNQFLHPRYNSPYLPKVRRAIEERASFGTYDVQTRLALFLSRKFQDMSMRE